MKIVMLKSREPNKGSGEIEFHQIILGFKSIGISTREFISNAPNEENQIVLSDRLLHEILSSAETIKELNPYAIILFVKGNTQEIENYILTSSQLFPKFRIIFMVRQKISDTFFDLPKNHKVFVLGPFYLPPSRHYLEMDFFPNVDIKPKEPYCLAFVGRHSLDKIKHLADLITLKIICLCEALPTKTFHYDQNKIEIFNYQAYGGQTWLTLLKNCDAFFEPNDFLSCSVLEASHFNKPIIFLQKPETMPKGFSLNSNNGHFTSQVLNRGSLAPYDIRRITTELWATI